jgi:hypothetical protein
MKAYSACGKYSHSKAPNFSALPSESMWKVKKFAEGDILMGNATR